MARLPILNSEFLGEELESPYQDYTAPQSSSKTRKVLSTVQKLLKLYWERRELLNNVHQTSNDTNQYERKKESFQISHKLGKFVDVLTSLNSTLVRIENEGYKRKQNDSQLFMSQYSSEDASIPHKLEFVIDIYAIPIMAVIGLMMCMTGIYFLSSGARRGQIYSLMLSTLILFDSSYLFFEVLRGVGSYIMSVSSKFYGAFHITLISAIRFFGLASIFMLLAISHARLCAIRRPFKYNSSMLSWKERKKIWRKYLIPVVTLSLILTFPLLLTYQFAMDDNTKKDPVITPSSLPPSILYSLLYIDILNLGLLGIIPAILLYLAYQIRRELMKNDEVKAQITPTQSQKRVTFDPNTKLPGTSSKETKTSRSLVVGIIIFVTLQTFRIITTLGELYFMFETNKDNRSLEDWSHFFASLSELLMVIYTSLKVLIHLNPYLSTSSNQGVFPPRNSRNPIILFKKRISNITIATLNTILDETPTHDEQQEDDKKYI